MNMTECIARCAAQLRSTMIRNPDGTTCPISEEEVQRVIRETVHTVCCPSSLSGLIGNDYLPFEIEVHLDQPDGPRLYLREDFHDGDVQMDLQQVRKLQEALEVAARWMKTSTDDDTNSITAAEKTALEKCLGS